MEMPILSDETRERAADLLFQRRYLELLITERMRLDEAIQEVQKEDVRSFVAWLEGFYCPGCSTPNFPTFPIPLKELQHLKKLAEGK